MSHTNHVFVDYENVHEVDLDLVAGKEVVVHLVLGERHKNLPLEMVKRLVKYKEQVRLVKAGKSGKNALDFVLAYRVGVESAAPTRFEVRAPRSQVALGNALVPATPLPSQAHRREMEFRPHWHSQVQLGNEGNRP